MNKIKNWIIGHKKTSIAIGIATVFLIAIGSIVLTFNARQVADSRKQIEIVDTKQKEEALAKKVDEAKKVLDTKIENVDKLSTEDKHKLEAVKKQLSEAIEKKDEQNIVKFQNEFKTALNNAKTNVEKVLAEEKAKEEQAKKEKEEAEKKAEEEKQKAEENKPTENATVSNTTPAPASSASEAKPSPQVESKPTETPAPEPTPAPQPEAPKPTPEKPKEKKRIGQLGNSGLEFKTYDELLSYIDNNFKNLDNREILENKIGYAIKGWSGWSVDYSDGTQTWTINWKAR